MSRRLYRAIFLVVFAQIAAPAPLWAQASLRERFLTEGPKGWQTLKVITQQLEGDRASRYQLAEHPPVATEGKFKINRDHFVTEGAAKDADGKIKTVRATGVNSKYRF